MKLNNINILIVEDDQTQQKMYADCIKEYNKGQEENHIQFTQLYMIDDFSKTVFENHFDSLIVDLTLGEEASGNEVIKKVLECCRFPVFVVSGDLNKLDIDMKESLLFNIYKRDDDFYEILDRIVNIYMTGYSKALSFGGKLDKMINEVFWKYLNDDSISFSNCNNDQKANRILRYALSRVSDTLSLSSTDKHDEFCACECVIIPPIEAVIFPGDIVSYEDKEYIIISADCDIENSKSEYITMCKLNSNYYDELVSCLYPETAKKAEETLKKLVNNNLNRYHLIPATSKYSGNVIDFQQVFSFSKEKTTEMCRVATISADFMKDVRARFTSYYGRQGQPQLMHDEILNQIRENIKKTKACEPSLC